MQMSADPHTDAGEALSDLAQRYWYPVYVYMRRRGHSPAGATEVARRFMAHLLDIVRSGQALPKQKHFRSFLLGHLDAFLDGDWDASNPPERPDTLSPPPENLERRFERDGLRSVPPEQAYQRSFALEVIARALKRLRMEAGSSGHMDMYVALEPYLGSDPPAGCCQELAQQLDTRPLALVVALKRLRQRFRELVGEELADTVNSAQDLVVEHRTMHSVLRKLSS